MSKKVKKLTDRQIEFINCYRKNAGDIVKVSNEMCITPRQVERYLENQFVREQIERSVQLARDKIKMATPYLVDLAMEMVNDENTSDKIRTQLLSTLLDRGGINAPKEPYVSININTEISDRARALLANTLQKDYTQQIECEQQN